MTPPVSPIPFPPNLATGNLFRGNQRGGLLHGVGQNDSRWAGLGGDLQAQEYLSPEPKTPAKGSAPCERGGGWGVGSWTQWILVFFPFERSKWVPQRKKHNPKRSRGRGKGSWAETELTCSTSFHPKRSENGGLRLLRYLARWGFLESEANASRQTGLLRA